MITTASLFESDGTDERSLGFLAAALEKNNLPGFDYFEFKKAVSALGSMDMEEAVAFKSAFTTASTLGLTKEKLLETAGYYRDLLRKEKDHFESALADQHQQRVEARASEIKRLQDQIDRHKAEIARLQDEVGGYLNAMESAQTQMQADAEKLEKAQKQFGFTHQSVLLQIERDIERIHQHI
jgi:uncharacterized protein YPO0396